MIELSCNNPTKFSDVPGPPLNLTVADWDRDRSDLTWDRPKSDGGADILCYVVECKERFKNDWVKCGRTDGPDTAATVTDVIKEGKAYEFRVRAVNKAGEGPPSEPTKQVRRHFMFV